MSHNSIAMRLFKQMRALSSRCEDRGTASTVAEGAIEAVRYPPNGTPHPSLPSAAQAFLSQQTTYHTCQLCHASQRSSAQDVARRPNRLNVYAFLPSVGVDSSSSTLMARMWLGPSDAQ